MFYCCMLCLGIHSRAKLSIIYSSGQVNNSSLLSFIIIMGLGRPGMSFTSKYTDRAVNHTHRVILWQLLSNAKVTTKYQQTHSYCHIYIILFHFKISECTNWCKACTFLYKWASREHQRQALFYTAHLRTTSQHWGASDGLNLVESSNIYTLYL